MVDPDEARQKLEDERKARFAREARQYMEIALPEMKRQAVVAFLNATGVQAMRTAQQRLRAANDLENRWQSDMMADQPEE